MIQCDQWDVVLVPFPFTNLETVKKRPALVISPNDYNRGEDIIILFITSNLSSFGRPGDYKLMDWKLCGLPKPSIVRMKFATVLQRIIIKKMGRLTKRDRTKVREALSTFFQT
ncbi:MAG: type II toxin-antitoxin system PemK/MazF family toxin [Balneolaceae bacterium]